MVLSDYLEVDNDFNTDHYDSFLGRTVSIAKRNCSWIQVGSDLNQPNEL